MACASTAMRPRPPRSPSPPRCSTECSTLDARTPSASPDQQRGTGAPLPLPPPCNTLHRVAGWRFAAAAIDIAAHPPQHGLRRRAEQVSHGVERQTVAVQADSRSFGRFRCTVPFKTSELVAAPFAAPPLLARNDAVPDQTATAAPGTVRTRGNHQNAKL